MKTAKIQGVSSLSSNIEAKNLSIGYSGITILDKITFNILQGERVAVVGPMGLVNQRYSKPWWD